MDARPHRPTRSIRTHTDENCAPIVCSKQHSLYRQKSTNHVVMPVAGGLKVTARRTAFGDVSNKVKNLSKPQDDSGRHQNDIVKRHEPEGKSIMYLNSSQKHLGAVTTKVPWSGVKSNSEINQNGPTSKTVPSYIQISTRRTLLKRNTSIYKDSDAKSIESTQHQAPRLESVLNVESARCESESCQQKNQRLPGQIYPNDDQNLGIVTKSPKKRHTYQNVLVEDHQNKVIASNESFHSAKPFLNKENDKDEYDLYDIDGVLTQEPTQRCLPQLFSDTEEYWEEDEDENFDDRGQLTLHSHPSYDENVTSGATTILSPKISTKIKQELESAKKHTEKIRSIEDIGDERWDTSMVAEYSDEIFAYMRELEAKMLPNAHYMDLQTEIQWSMRSILMDWLIQVHYRFSLLPETLFLCVNYVDRFLSCKIVSLAKLQLVGATAIFVAAKYEEINCPSVNEIIYMVDGGYTADEILKAERFMLNMLQFELGWPGPMSFLRRISKADEYDYETRTLAKYFLEVTIMDERFIGSPPSYIAAGSHCLARLMLRRGNWTKQHIYYSGYTWTQLRPLVAMIKECCENPQKHHNAVFEKYSDRKYRRAAQFVFNEIRGFTLPSAQPYKPTLLSAEHVISQNFQGKHKVLRQLVKS